MDEDGLSLLKDMLIYMPFWRTTAKNALSHRYLRDVPLKLPPIPEICKQRTSDDGRSLKRRRAD